EDQERGDEADAVETGHATPLLAAVDVLFIPPEPRPDCGSTAAFTGPRQRLNSDPDRCGGSVRAPALPLWEGWASAQAGTTNSGAPSAPLTLPPVETEAVLRQARH